MTPLWHIQRRRLSRWLKEWEAEQVLRRALPAVSRRPRASRGRRAPVAAQAPTPPLSVGQVRLLYPAPSDDPAQRPLYVAVLAEPSSGFFLVAPFGRFAEPAVPGEWQTGLKAMPLRVLCLWNARGVESRLLERSWRAGTLPPVTICRALDLNRRLHSATPLQTVTGADVGPPLRHPLDPRHTYLEEESALLEENLSALASASCDAITAFPYQQVSAPLLKAAEDHTPYTPGTKKRRRRNRP